MVIWAIAILAIAWWLRRRYLRKKQERLVREHLGPYAGLTYKSRR